MKHLLLWMNIALQLGGYISDIQVWSSFAFTDMGEAVELAQLLFNEMCVFANAYENDFDILEKLQILKDEKSRWLIEGAIKYYG